jgi:ribonuclease VapC
VSKIVLDASAVIAVLFREPGAEKLTLELLEIATIGTVNLAEVQARLVRAGDDPQEAWKDAVAFVPEVHPFTIAQAKIAGSLVTQTRGLGLSLGDRACLALAMTLNAPVYTTDRIWKKLDVGVRIHVIR